MAQGSRYGSVEKIGNVNGDGGLVAYEASWWLLAVVQDEDAVQVAAWFELQQHSDLRSCGSSFSFFGVVAGWLLVRFQMLHRGGYVELLHFPVRLAFFGAAGHSGGGAAARSMAKRRRCMVETVEWR